MGLRWSASFVALTLLFSRAVYADPVANFYAGKTITIVVGSEPGGNYDAQAQLMARHIGNFIPGHPSVIVQDMPGAGSIIAANYLYNSAPEDGATIGLIQHTLLTANLTGQMGVRFDVRRFNWIGNLASDLPLVVSWYTSPIKTTADLFTGQLVMGGGGPTSDSEVTARLLNQMIGTRIKIISGYTGEMQIQLAMERGEVEGMGGFSWPVLKMRSPYYLTDHKVNILLQGAVERAPDLPNVPTPFDYVKNDDNRKILELFYSQQATARPVVAPPDVPADRVAALRQAFVAMSQDRAFHNDADKSKLEADSTPYESIEKVIDIVSSTPPAIAAKFAAINNPPS
jgi:tripartite-type tricarboxylate transporter receptor subunit TctC